MSRTLLILALVALLFAGVMAQDSSSSSSSTGDASSTIDSSSTAAASSTAVSSSTAVASSTAVSSSSAASTGSSSSSTGAVSSSSSTGSSSNSSIVSSSSSSSTGSAAANFTIGLQFASLFNSTLDEQNAASDLASVLKLGSAQCLVTLINANARRLLAVQYQFNYLSVGQAAVDQATSLVTADNLQSALGNYGVDPSFATVNGNSINTNSPASALAASPLLLAAAAVFAMLF